MIYKLIPWVVGFLTLLQAGLNRKIAVHWGLSSAIVLNSAIVLFIATLYFFVARSFPLAVPELLRVKSGSLPFEWWYVVPGLCGFLLILGIPMAMNQIGAFQTFIFIVIAQLSASLMWDVFVEALPLTLTRIVGAVLVALGAVLVMK